MKGYIGVVENEQPFHKGYFIKLGDIGFYLTVNG